VWECAGYRIQVITILQDRLVGTNMGLETLGTQSSGSSEPEVPNELEGLVNLTNNQTTQPDGDAFKSLDISSR
jgi:hypothetical protein